MKKKLSILIALVMAISLCLMPAMVVNASSALTVDGVIGEGEWDGAVVIPVDGGMGTVKVIASRNYLYMLFEGDDPTDARDGENTYGNDKLSININPTDGGPWGKPYDIVFQTGADLAAFTTPDPDIPGSSGNTDCWKTEWVIDGVQLDLPDDVETMTLYSGDRRVSEWKIPLATISPLGSTILVGGNCDNLGDTGSGYKFPPDLEWAVASTYVTIEIPPAPERDSLMVLMPFGQDTTGYIGDSSVLRGSIDVIGIYDGTGYKLVIPGGCTVERPTGERISCLYLKAIDNNVLTFTTNDVEFSEPCTLYTTEGELTYNMWGRLVTDGEWVEVGTFTSIVNRKAYLGKNIK